MLPLDIFINIVSIMSMPVLLAIFSYVNPRVVFTRRLTAIAYWLELAVVTRVFWPIISGQIEQLIINENFRVDRLAVCFILLTTFVFASTLSHANYLFGQEEAQEHGAIKLTRLRTFYLCVNLFYLALFAVFLSNNLGCLWMSVEATTLSSASLVYFERTKNALEATWKYLIICSVGIALALLGTVFLFASSQHGHLTQGTLIISDLVAQADKLNHPFLKIGFILCLLGYGTKAGIFPLHSWLPDAHSEAPAPASALLSGALLNGALFSIWRITTIVMASPQHEQIMQIILGMGALTVFAAALFLIRQHGFKRMWAYSSVENVGIMLVAIGLGSSALFFLQALNHSIVKVALFLISGNIVEAGGTTRLANLHGILKSCPMWGCLLALATFAITGAPPFGTFLSKVSILAVLADRGSWILAAVLVTGTSLAFVSISVHIGRVLLGSPKASFSPFEVLQTSLVPILLLCCSVILGVMVYPSYWNFLQ
jgi:hydrogenase-4 component F